MGAAIKWLCPALLLLTSCSVERIAIGTSGSQYVPKEQFESVVQVIAQRLKAIEEAQKKADESTKPD